MEDYKGNGKTRRPAGATSRPEGTRRPVGTTPRPEGARRPAGSTSRPEGTRRPAGTTPRPEGARRPAGTTPRPEGARRQTGTTSRSNGAIGAPEKISAGGARRSSGTSGNRTASSASRPTSKNVDPRKKTASGNGRPSQSVDTRKSKLKKQQKTVLLICMVLIGLLLVVGIMSSIINALNNKGKKDSTSSTSQTGTVTTAPGNDDQSGDSGNTNEPSPTPEATPTPTVEPSQVTLVAFGDDLVHTGVFRAGHQADGSYDYSVLFKGVKPVVEAADLSILNQETIFGGDSAGLMSYPKFNSPSAIGDAAVNAGFDVFTHATNHALDMDLKGLLNCVQYWKEKHPDITVVGIYENAEEQKNIAVKEVNGIKIAILNYTYSHNWETFSTAAEGHLNLLCSYDPTSRKIDFNTINPQVIEDIKKAEEIADFTIVCPHWGVEYTHTPTEQEKNFAKLMTEAGADLIIGTHPHVIQPVDWVTSDNGNKSLVYYSLGNFTSTQDEWARILGGMAQLTIKKDNSGIYIDPDSVKAVPVVTHYVYPGWNGATVVDSTYFLKDYTADMAAKHGLKGRCGITVTRENLIKLSQQVFGDYCSELE